jgi:hypothetical protein
MRIAGREHFNYALCVVSDFACSSYILKIHLLQYLYILNKQGWNVP